MNIQLPTTCPVCDGDWETTGHTDGLYRNRKCSNGCRCQLVLEATKQIPVFLRRELAGLEIWWHKGGYIDFRSLELMISQVDHKFRPLGFSLPFDIDEERLKLLLAYS
jgi:hypothetical protein